MGTHPLPSADASVDLYALTHNETSTGVAMTIRRPAGPPSRPTAAGWSQSTASGAGGLRVDPAEFDTYYLAPQKCFASDGGLWVACRRPRSSRSSGSPHRAAGSRPSSTSRRPSTARCWTRPTLRALATIFLLAEQLDWTCVQLARDRSAGSSTPGPGSRCTRPFVDIVRTSTSSARRRSSSTLPKPTAHLFPAISAWNVSFAEIAITRHRYWRHNLRRNQPCHSITDRPRASSTCR